jgi:hypothetical protein
LNRIFPSYHGSIAKAFADIDEPPCRALHADLYALLDRFNVARDEALVIPGGHLEAIVTQRR